MRAKKMLDIELMRIFAALFVIFNHTGILGFFMFSEYKLGSLHFWVYMFISVFCKFSVPLFFMISGALLLNRTGESLRDLWKHRVLKMTILLVVWSLLYYLVGVLFGQYSFGFTVFVKGFLTDNWAPHLWYLYAYIAMLMSLPLLRKFAQGLSNNEYVYLIALYLAFACICPVAEYLLWQWNSCFNTSVYFDWICSTMLIYPCLGYFLRHRIRDFWNKKRLGILCGVNVAAISLTCYLTYVEAKVTGICDESHSQTFYNTFAVINSVTIFVSCQYFVEHVQIREWMQRVIQSVGNCTFGIYLLHLLFLFYMPKQYEIFFSVQDILHLQKNPMVCGMLYTIFFFLMGYITTLLMKRIPFVRRMVS